MKRSFVGGLFSGFAMLALVLVVAQAVSAGSSLSAAQVAARSQAAEVSAAALGTDFLYQGQLKQSGTPPTTSCSMAFRLFDAASRIRSAAPLRPQSPLHKDYSPSVWTLAAAPLTARRAGWVSRSNAAAIPVSRISIRANRWPLLLMRYTA